MGGFDVRWNSSVPGLAVGFSWAAASADVKGNCLAYHTTYSLASIPNHVPVAQADFIHDKWHLAGEYRRNIR